MLFLVSAFVIILTYFCMNYMKNRRFWRCLEDFYGFKPLPLIGNAHQIGKTTEEMLWNLYEIFKKANYTTYKLILGNDVLIGLCDPDTIEVLLTNNQELTKMDEYNFFKEWLGDGLLLSTGSKWKTRRKIITPTFHFKILEQFVRIFNSNGDILVNELSKRVNEGEVFDIYPFVNVCALDIICESAMGVQINAQTTTDSEYVQAVHSICKLVKERIFSPLKRINWYYRLTKEYKQYTKYIEILHAMTNCVIKKRREMLTEKIERVRNGEALLEKPDEIVGRKAKVAFLDLLLLSKLPDGSFLLDEDIREEVDTFMFAGHDTTTSAIAFALYSLANDPQIQQKAFEEISDVIGNDPNTELTYEVLQKLKYLEMVIKETLRLYPSVPGFGRRIKNDMRLPDGKIVPGGCLVFADIFALGRNPRYYTNHNDFDPERFLTENWTGKNPFMFVPFSGGSRNCIGQKFAMLEMKSILVKILIKYKLMSGGDHAKLRITSEIILKPMTGVNIALTERSTEILHTLSPSEELLVAGIVVERMVAGAAKWRSRTGRRGIGIPPPRWREYAVRAAGQS